MDCKGERKKDLTWVIRGMVVVVIVLFFVIFIIVVNLEISILQANENKNILGRAPGM